VTLWLSAYAWLALADDPERAARLEGAAEGLRRRVGLRAWPLLRPVEADLVARVHQRLGEERFDQAFAAGSRLTPAGGGRRRPGPAGRRHPDSLSRHPNNAETAGSEPDAQANRSRLCAIASRRQASTAPPTADHWRNRHKRQLSHQAIALGATGPLDPGVASLSSEPQSSQLRTHTDQPVRRVPRDQAVDEDGRQIGYVPGGAPRVG